jgi:glycosyltransferase involved in cell wall biosynthesis
LPASDRWLVNADLERNLVLPETEQPLTVLHCLWHGRPGGTPRAVYQLVREQIRNPRLRPAVLFAQASGAYWEAANQLDCHVVTAVLASGRDIRGLRRTTRAMEPYALHHFHSAEPLLALASLRCRGRTRVYTHRGGFIEYSARKRAQYAVFGAMVRRGFRGVSGNTAHAADSAARLLRLDRARIDVTYNGLDFSLLEPRRAGEDVRRELGLESDDFVLGTAAELREWKRIDRLLDMLAVVSEPRLRLLIVGDGEDRARLQGRASDLGVENRVTFAGSQIHVGDYLQTMQAFCLPSMGHESFGNAAVEAMAVGIPTIVFADGGGMLEHIESGETGFVVDDQRGLEETVRTLIRDPELRSRVGEQGRRAVRERYTLERADAAYEEFYAAAVHGAATGD